MILSKLGSELEIDWKIKNQNVSFLDSKVVLKNLACNWGQNKDSITLNWTCQPIKDKAAGAAGLF